MTPEDVQALFTSESDEFRFARWGRPIVPIVFGVDAETLSVVKGAIEVVVGLAGHQMADTDPEMGANLMVFFLRDWSELNGVPDIDHLIPEMAELLPRLEEQNANQYRLFRFESDGSIRAAFVFLRMDEVLAELPAETLALSQIVQVMLLWGSRAFAETSPLARVAGVEVLRPEIAALIRAAYDPVLPAALCDASHALRLFARLKT
ncbi:MAG: hypothetical protein COB40_08795 [Marinosulfonomonas sp.]|nr:MAG: hypothetical protein COB40_08795 [Marinosulfonomonas sp.]